MQAAPQLWDHVREAPHDLDRWHVLADALASDGDPRAPWLRIELGWATARDVDAVERFRLLHEAQVHMHLPHLLPRPPPNPELFLWLAEVHRWLAHPWNPDRARFHRLAGPSVWFLRHLPNAVDAFASQRRIIVSEVMEQLVECFGRDRAPAGQLAELLRQQNADGQLAPDLAALGQVLAERCRLLLDPSARSVGDGDPLRNLMRPLFGRSYNWSRASDDIAWYAAMSPFQRQRLAVALVVTADWHDIWRRWPRGWHVTWAEGVGAERPGEALLPDAYGQLDFPDGPAADLLDDAWLQWVGFSD
ncbi:MAG: hypothetical protein AAGA48_06620 [Myxococcota bacterium]